MERTAWEGVTLRWAWSVLKQTNLFYCGSLVDRKWLASFGCAYQPPQAGGAGVGIEVRVVEAIPVHMDMYYIQRTRRELNKLKVFYLQTQRQGQHPPLLSTPLPLGPKHQGLE